MDSGKVSACLYIGRDVLETAKRLGLNVSRVSENALIAAIGRLQNPETRNESNGSAEPSGAGGGTPTQLYRQKYACNMLAENLRNLQMTKVRNTDA